MKKKKNINLVQLLWDWSTTQASSNGELWLLWLSDEKWIWVWDGLVQGYNNAIQTAEFGNVKAYSTLQVIGYVEALEF